jgi:hypothetical protein
VNRPVFVRFEEGDTTVSKICVWFGVLLAAAVFVQAAQVNADDQAFKYPPTTSLEEVEALVEKAPKEHPRLLASAADLAALKASVEDDPLRQSLARAVVEQAIAMEKVAPITREQQGRRLLGQSRRCVQRVVTLAMAYHLTGDLRHVRRCEKEMLTAAGFTDWNPSHFLDVAEMTFALAIGYDWLYGQLDDSSRDKIRAAIIEKGVILPFETRHKGWVRSRNNWGQVCHGGLVAGALAVMEDRPDLAARTVHNAIHNVTQSMDTYAPSGGYPEGPGYWCYGTSYNVLLIGVLESSLGADLGLSRAPGFDKTGQYLNLVCGPSGDYFNYADGGSQRTPQSVLFWFASRYDRPDWLLGEPERWISSIAALSSSNAGSGAGRLAPLALLWMDDAKKNAPIKMPLHWSSEGETPITIHRSSWTDPGATFVGFKGGSPSASHGQMDIGSFVLDADGVRWALDLGSESYHGIESRGMNLWSRTQNSDRWTIFRQSNEGHNTLVIDGQLQLASGSGEILQFSDEAGFAHSIMDLSSVYKGQAESAMRGVVLLPSGEVLIQDQLSGLKPGSRVRWGMITRAAAGTGGISSIALRRSSESLDLAVVAPSSAAWHVIDTAEPRHEWDSPNRDTRMVAFEAVAPESGELTLAVLATPGSCTGSVRGTLKLRRLNEWKSPDPKSRANAK